MNSNKVFNKFFEIYLFEKIYKDYTAFLLLFRNGKNCYAKFVPLQKPLKFKVASTTSKKLVSSTGVVLCVRFFIKA